MSCSLSPIDWRTKGELSEAKGREDYNTLFLNIISRVVASPLTNILAFNTCSKLFVILKSFKARLTIETQCWSSENRK